MGGRIYSINFSNRMKNRRFRRLVRPVSCHRAFHPPEGYLADTFAGIGHLHPGTLQRTWNKQIPPVFPKIAHNLLRIASSYPSIAIRPWTVLNRSAGSTQEGAWQRAYNSVALGVPRRSGHRDAMRVGQDE